MTTSKWLLATTAMLAVTAVGSGCSKKNSNPTPNPTVTVTQSTSSNPTIVVVNGYQGYYQSNVFCSYLNNYCGTGMAFGIAPPTVIVNNGYEGYWVSNSWCDWTNDYCGTGLSWGIALPIVIVGNSGYYGYYDNSSWCDWTNNYCGSDLSWGISGNGTSYTGNGSGNGSGGYSSGGTTNGSGSGYSSGGTTNGSGTGYSSGGTTNGSGSGFSTGGTTNGSGTGSTSTGGTTNGSGTGYSLAGGTKDVDLQRADVQLAAIEDRAQGLASQFSMDVAAARQLTQLADRMNQLTTTGKMTDDDRSAIAEAALGVAGVTQDEVTAAYTKLGQGDKTAVDQLLTKAAGNLGMPSTAGLRDQILPSLGINLGVTH